MKRTSIIDGTAPRQTRRVEVTYGFNITKEDEKIDFDKNQRQVYNQIRGLNSWPDLCMLKGKR